ncbi:hypothetical protein HYU16_02505 [Candidatus Woesearchaeota archaeon]|nr:hypothetical protein [Candidatus Woesearchaeota archaeon]
MQELTVIRSSAATGGPLSLEMLIVGQDGFLTRLDGSSEYWAPIGDPKLLQVAFNAASVADRRDFQKKLAGELAAKNRAITEMAAKTGATGTVFYKPSDWVYDKGLIAVQFYVPSPRPATFDTKSGNRVTAEPVGGPAVLWYAKNEGIDLSCLGDVWDGVFRFKKPLDMDTAGYALGELQHMPQKQDAMPAGSPINWLDEISGGTLLDTRAAIQFYMTNRGGLGTRSEGRRPTQRVAERVPTPLPRV